MTRPLLRWLAPVAAAVVFTGGGAAVSSMSNAAHADLPARSAATLITDVAHAHLRGLSGTLEQSADLGLPALPAGMAGQGSTADVSALLSGSHTMRFWYAAPGKSHVQLLGDGSESDLIGDGSSLWVWSSADHAVTHYRLPAGSDQAAPMAGGAATTTPQRLAHEALSAIGPSTQVTTNGSAVVAGRPAYLLTIAPRTTDTLVDSVQIAIDSATHIPTRVQVFARGHAAPAFSLGYSSFDPTTPAASRFTFTPPPGTKVTEKSLPSETGHPAGTKPPGSDGARPAVVGSGWSSVIVLPAARGRSLLSQQANGSGATSSLLRQLSRVSGSWGSGRLLTGTLISAVIDDDGRVAVGAVPPAALYAALQHAAAPH